MGSPRDPDDIDLNSLVALIVLFITMYFTLFYL